MSVQNFDAYEVPRPSIAATCRNIDAERSYVVQLHNENVELRRDNQRLRRAAAAQLACFEAERAESSRLRRENQRLSAELKART